MNDWNITVRDVGLIGGVADGTEEELQVRIDKLDAQYTEAVKKISDKYKTTFITSKARKRIIKNTKTKK